MIPQLDPYPNPPTENKRKIDDHTETSINKKRMEGYKCVDLIVLGLPWKTSEEELREYFEQYGELLMSQVRTFLVCPSLGPPSVSQVRIS